MRASQEARSPVSSLFIEYHGSVTSRQTYLLACIIFVVFLGFSLARLDGYAHDETAAHFPNALNFYTNGLAATFNSQYSAANTPLPYIIVALAAKLTSPTLIVARVVTCVTSFLVFLVVVRLLEITGTARFLGFGVLFYPYLFLNSFVFYAVNYGLLFALLALMFILHTPRNASYVHDLIAGLFLALAVLCQQFYLVIPLAVLISRLVHTADEQEGMRRLSIRRAILSTALLSAPMIVPFLLFIAWGGLTHPNFREQAIGCYPSPVVASLTVTGFYFLPFLFQSFRTVTRTRFLSALVVSVLLVLAFRPDFADKYGPGAFAGVVHHLIALSGRMHEVVPVLLTIGLTLSGILVLMGAWSRLSLRREYFLFASCLLLTLAYSFFTFIGERHLLGFMVFLFLLVLPWVRKPLDRLYPAGMAVIGIGYFFWWLYFKWA